MRRRNTLFVAIGFLGVVIVGGAIALVTADFGRLKSRVVESVERATGRSLVVGEMTLRILPVPTLSIKNAVLGNAAWGSSPQMAKVGDISARFALLPLVFGEQLRVTRLRVTDVELYLETDASGRGNWAFADATTKPTTQPISRPKSAADPEQPMIGDAVVQDVVITYHDGRGDTTSTASLDSIKLAGSATSTAFNFDLAIDGNGLPTVPVAASERLSSVEYHIAATVTGDPDKLISMKSIHGSFGPSSFSGEASLTLNGPRPVLTATLDVPMIDLTQTQPTVAGRPAKSANDRVFSSNPLPVPFDVLRAFDGDLTLKVAAFKSRNATMANVSAHLRLDDRNLQIAPFSVDVGGGHVVGKISLSAREAPSSVAVSVEGKEIDIGKIVASLSGEDLLEGKGDLTIAAQGKGDSMHAIMASLDGDSSVVVGRGVIKHEFVDLVGADVFRDAFALDQGKQTANLNCMVARFAFRRGQATAHGLLMDTADVTLSGHGTVDLGSERVKLEMTPRPKERSLLALPVTVDIGGTLAHLTAQSDTVLIAKDVAVDVASSALSPALLVMPTLLGSGGNQNPCLRALGNVNAADAPNGGAQRTQPDENKDSVGAALDDIGRSIDKFFSK